jgi:hypothetical protein
VPRVISDDELTQLSLKLAEAYGQVRGMRHRLEEADDGPLAILAALRVQTVESELETCLENLAPLHELLSSVTVDT